MRKVIRATPLCKFLRYCNDSPLDKTVLDCGAGGDDPPLRLFLESGYKTVGIEISEVSLNETRKFCKEFGLRLNMFKGDMRKLPFKNETFSFVYTYNSIHMMSKKNVAVAMSEIKRVLKTNGLCFVNFVSADEPPHAGAVEINKGEFLKKDIPWHGVKCPNIDSYFEDDAPDVYFSNFKVVHKEKRIIERIIEGKKVLQAYIDYIAKKK